MYNIVNAMYSKAQPLAVLLNCLRILTGVVNLLLRKIENCPIILSSFLSDSLSNSSIIFTYSLFAALRKRGKVLFLLQRKIYYVVFSV